MPKLRHYSPQLSKELVSRLYHQAKAERVPMTVLANRIVEEAPPDEFFSSPKEERTQRFLSLVE